MQAAIHAVRTRNSTPRVIPLQRTRFWLICLFFAFWVCAIAARLFWLQIIRHQDYVERAQKQQQRTFEVAPRRGVLYDRNLHELAMTVQVDSVYADPSEIDDKKAAAHTLAALVHIDPQDGRTAESEIAARLASGHNFAWIARRVTPDVSTRVHALNMKGISFKKEFQRFYPTTTSPRRCLDLWALTTTTSAASNRNSIRNCTALPARCIPPWTRAAKSSARANKSRSPAAT
jgi:cell division protein FtsI (penicillin-binding protein 3)